MSAIEQLEALARKGYDCYINLSGRRDYFAFVGDTTKTMVGAYLEVTIRVVGGGLELTGEGASIEQAWDDLILTRTRAASLTLREQS